MLLFINGSFIDDGMNNELTLTDYPLPERCLSRLYNYVRDNPSLKY